MVPIFFIVAVFIGCVCRFALDCSVLTSLLLSGTAMPLSLVIRRRSAALLPAVGRVAPRQFRGSLSSDSRDPAGIPVRRKAGSQRATEPLGGSKSTERPTRGDTRDGSAPERGQGRSTGSEGGTRKESKREAMEESRHGADRRSSGAARSSMSARNDLRDNVDSASAPAGARSAGAETSEAEAARQPRAAPAGARRPPQTPEHDEDDPSSPLSPPGPPKAWVAARRTAPGAQQDKAVNDQRERLGYAMRLFQVQTGQRQLAVGVLTKLLAEPLRVPSFRLAAACLLGEIFRGQADFARAQQYYELSMQEAEAIPEEQRNENDWYVHYRPRALLGLALTMRRNLHAPEEIRTLLKEARDRFAALDSADLPAQLMVLEGLLNRQLGDADGAQVLLRDALQGLRRLSPPFLLLWPEHIQALLAQTYLLSNSGRALAAKQARELLNSTDSGPWTLAVAASVLLHLRLDLLLSDRARPDEIRAELAAPEPGAPKTLLQRLHAAAAAEGDPFLLTESAALHAAWYGAAGDLDAVAEHIARLETHSRGAIAPLVVLRAVEASALWQSCGLEEAPAIPALHALRLRGRQALDEIAAALPAYQCSADHTRKWRQCLSGGALLTQEESSYWLGEELLALRNCTWP